MINKKYIAPILSIVAICIGGYLLFNVGFILFAILVNFPLLISGEESFFTTNTLFLLISEIIGIGVIWILLKKYLTQEMFKHTILATLLTLPLMVPMVIIGILLYQKSDLINISVGAIIIISSLIYCYVKKVPWVYIFSIVYVALLALYVQMAGIEI